MYVYIWQGVKRGKIYAKKNKAFNFKYCNSNNF